jgi:16S rRNA processing protein RimM
MTDMTPTSTHRVARIGKPHGLRGEVTVQVHTDNPQDRFVPGAAFATDPPQRGPLTLQTVRVHQGVYLLGFDGVPDRTAAESLRGTGLVVTEAEAADEEEGWYEEDLLGFTVALADGTVVGEVSALHTRPVQDLLEVRLSDGRQALVPFVEELVPEVDEESRRVVVEPPPGLLDLDAPGQ